MIRALILYYLSIKPTHGYDIQRYIEINGMDKWARIQSGSIYYALGKLEKEELIYTLREERNGARIRKIYAINDKGKEELRKLLKEELLKPLISVESDKFIVPTMLNKVSKEEITSQVNEHIKLLKEKKAWWQGGKNLKIGENSLKIDILNFDMVISNLEYQIKWHETLLEELDQIHIFAAGAEKLIGNVDFSSLENMEFVECSKCQSRIDELKFDMVKNPHNLEEKIEELIRLIKK